MTFRSSRSKRTSLAIAAALAIAAPASAIAIGVSTADTQLAANSVLAGAAKVDSTWHVGAAAGQYATDGTAIDHHGVDPSAHSTRRVSSYGIEGREAVRALVVQGADGTRFALISNDLYIPQDLLNRRVAGILAEHDRNVMNGLTPGKVTGITPENLTISVSHSHSSPYYSTPSWGVWAFQDVFDIRFFETIANKMAQAVIQASSDLRPVRIGAAVSPFTHLKRHSFGPAIANDGTPAGYPQTDVDKDLTVVRFDDISNPADAKPLATWVVFGLHPEMLNGNNLLTSEYVNTMQKNVEREHGGITLFSQSDTGTAEPARDLAAHAPHERQEFSHRDYAQMERAGRELTDAVLATSTDIVRVSQGAGAAISNNVVPFASQIPIGFKDLRFAPPSYRVFPTVSSCRTEKTFDGNPGVPIAGLPDCEYAFGGSGRNPAFSALPFDPAVTYRTMREAGVPIPDNVSAPSYTGLQETLQVHLQVIRLGDIAITVCPCEQWADQSRNIKSRLNTTPDDLWYGWDWTANYTQPGWQPGVNYANQVLGWCTQNANTTWSCKDPRNPTGPNLAPVSDQALKRMKAQIYNDAKGWDALDYTVQSETEPTDISKIKGNFTHEELHSVMDGGGYPLVITLGMTNDYWGYIATYREFQRGDHYRKALTGLGPHSSDFLATRLSRMAAELKGGPEVKLNEKDTAYTWDYEHQGLRQEALGQTARTHLAAYEEMRPADGGTPAIVQQPASIKRFSAAKVAWIGGSNYTDTPNPVVERCIDPAAVCDPANASHWQKFGDGFGEVQVKANFPQPQDMALYAAGQFAWKWEATFEAFDSDIVMSDASGVRRTQIPDGTYRFVIEGCHRGAIPAVGSNSGCDAFDRTGRVSRYHLTSQPFTVSPWDGLSVPSIGLEPDGRVSLTVGPEFAMNAPANLGGYRLPITASNTERGPIDYPDTYSSPFTRYIHGRDAADLRTYGVGPADDELFCLHCTFRPWAETGAVRSITVTIERSGGPSETAPAVYNPLIGRWITSATLSPGDRAYVAPGGLIDEFGELNGSASASVTG